jgi:hypothetical protein
VQQEHDGRAIRPGLAVEDVDAADGGGAVVHGPCAAGGFHGVRSFDDFCVENVGDTAEYAACLRPVPGQTGNVTPVSSSETVHRRRWMVVSRDCRLEWASFG